MRKFIPQSGYLTPSEDQVKLQVKLHFPYKIFNEWGMISVLASKTIEQKCVPSI